MLLRFYGKKKLFLLNVFVKVGKVLNSKCAEKDGSERKKGSETKKLC